MNKKIKKIAIIGGGTSALFLAAFLDTDKYEVSIYEKKKSPGRKFLVAGDGGFNLTHSEDLEHLKSRYSPPLFLDHALNAFDNVALRNWLKEIGIPSFVGSSGRVFPKEGIKPIEVLKTIRNYLIKKNIQFYFEKTFTDWTEDNAIILNRDEIINPDYTVFALGGASWKVTGSDGSWLNVFQDKGIKTIPFKSSNCAFKTDWDEAFIKSYEGQPLKNITISIDNKTQKGEAVITQFGIEGNAIYSFSSEIQKQLSKQKEALVFIDFKPTLSHSRIIDKIYQSKSNTTTTLKEKLKLPRAAIELIKMTLTKDAFLDKSILTNYIKNFPLTILDAAPLDEAISTMGGIDLTDINSYFELKKIKHQFCIGEMLDWNAPTGGYLIQGCASSAVYLAKHLNHTSKA